MNKVPVMATVSRAYGFLLGDFGTILRLAWAPLLLGAGLSFAFGSQALDAAIQSKGDPAIQMQYAPMQFLIGIAAFVGGVIATVALLRVVIYGDRKPGLFVYLWFGGAEFRLVMVTVLLIVASFAGIIGAALVFALLGALAAAVPALGVVVGFGVALMGPVFVWILIRLSLIAPVVVAEKSLGVERSWALTKGNGFRLFLVYLLTLVPLVVVSVLVALAVFGSDFPPLPSFPAPGGANDAEATRAAMEAFGKAMEKWQLGFSKALRLHWVEFSVLGFAGNLIQTALLTGVQGTAYTALAGEPRE